MSVNRGGAFAGGRDGGGTGSAYVTYARHEDARDAIAALDGTSLDGRPLRACFGTTKYCHCFLRGVACANPDCLFLHAEAPGRDSFTKEEMVARTAGQGSFAAAAAVVTASSERGDSPEGSEAARQRRGSGSGSGGSANGGGHPRAPPSRGRAGLGAGAGGLPLPLPLQMQQMALNPFHSGGAQPPLPPQPHPSHAAAYQAAGFPPLSAAPYDGRTMYGAPGLDEAQLRQRQLMMLSASAGVPASNGHHQNGAMQHAPGGVNAAIAAAHARAQGYPQPFEPGAAHHHHGGGGHHYEAHYAPRQQQHGHGGGVPYGAPSYGDDASGAAPAGGSQSRYRFANAAEDAAAAAAGRMWAQPGGGGFDGGGAAAAQLQAHRAMYEAASAAEAEARRALPPPAHAHVTAPQGGGRSRGRSGAPAAPFGGAVAAAAPPPGGQPREGRRHRRGGQRSGARQALSG